MGKVITHRRGRGRRKIGKSRNSQKGEREKKDREKS